MLHINDNRGFTLIELVVVMAILSIMSVIALPKLTGIFGDQRKESSIIKAYIEAVTDDSFVHRKINYLCIQLSRSGNKNAELFDDDYIDANMISVYEFKDGKFNQNKNNILKHRKAGSALTMNEVVLEGGRIINSGNVLIPFYSDGTSESFTLKISSGDSNISIVKNKVSKSVTIMNEP